MGSSGVSKPCFLFEVSSENWSKWFTLDQLQDFSQDMHSARKAFWKTVGALLQSRHVLYANDLSLSLSLCGCVCVSCVVCRVSCVVCRVCVACVFSSADTANVPPADPALLGKRMLIQNKSQNLGGRIIQSHGPGTQ